MRARLDSPLRLALIGMSGAGKTFWATRLADSGRSAVSCDDRIEARLAPRLAAGGFAGTQGVAAWMGWPANADYAQRESAYLAEEIGALGDILTELEKNPSRELVLDTTGSVIYTGNNLLLRLRRLMTVVYLAASPAEQHLLVERYLSDPKPVLWHGAFQPRQGETPRETVRRCYPALLASRRQSYETLAHCTLPVANLPPVSSDASQDAAAFLAQIAARLL